MAAPRASMALGAARGSIAVSGGSTSSSSGRAVAELLDSIVKKQNFKQLAGYSIKCLADWVRPDRMGWETVAVQAHEANGCSAVINCCIRHVNDAELLGFGLAAVRGILAAAGVQRVTSEAASVMVNLVQAMWTSSLTNAEKTTHLNAASAALIVMAQKGAPLADSGLPTVAAALIPTCSPAACALAEPLFALLPELAASQAGAAAVIAQPSLLSAIVSATAQLAASATPAAVLTVRRMLSHVLLLCDRIARVQDGSAKLQEMCVATALLPAVDWWLHGDVAPTPTGGATSPAVGAPASLSVAAKDVDTGFVQPALVLGLFNRLLGSDLTPLLALVRGTAPAAPAPITLDALNATSVHASRMLARIAELHERAAQLMRAPALLRDCASALSVAAGGLSTSTFALPVAVAMQTVWLRLLEASSDGASAPGMTHFLLWGGLPATLAVAGAAAGNASPVALTAYALAVRCLWVVLTFGAKWTVNASGVACTSAAPAAEAAVAGAAPGSGGVLCATVADGDATVLEYILRFQSTAYLSWLLAGVAASAHAPAAPVPAVAACLSALLLLRELCWLGDKMEVNLLAPLPAARLPATVAAAACVLAPLTGTPAASTAFANASWLPTAAASVAVQVMNSTAVSEGAMAAYLQHGAATAVLNIMRGGSAANPLDSVAATDVDKLAASPAVVPGAHVLFARPAWLSSTCVLEGGSACDVSAPESLAADAIYCAASMMSYLGACVDGEAMLPASAATALRSALTAVGEAAASVAALSDADLLNATLSTAMQAALSAFSRFSHHAEVYANFKELISVVGTGERDVFRALDLIREADAHILRMLNSAPMRTSAAQVPGWISQYEPLLEGFAQGTASPAVTALRTAAAAEQTLNVSLNISAQPQNYLLFLRQLIAAARPQLLLLEAVTLSAPLAWLIVSDGGVAALLRWCGHLAVALAVHTDIDTVKVGEAAGVRGAALTSELASLATGVEDLATRVTTALVHIARVACEARHSGEYLIADAEEEQEATATARTATGSAHEKSLALVLEAIMSRPVAATACASIGMVLGSGCNAMRLVPAVASLLLWLTNIVHVPVTRGDTTLDPSWPLRHVSMLIAADFMETAVALLRFLSTRLQPANSAALLPALHTVLLAVAAMAKTRQGASAMAIRGASRSILRLIAPLLSLAGSSKAGLPYMCLVAAVRVLHAAVQMSSDDAGGGDKGMSVRTLLHKQGIVSELVTVLFSGVGIVSGIPGADGELCTLALAIVSDMSTRKDVLAAVSMLRDVADATQSMMQVHALALMAEAREWRGLTPDAPTKAASIKHSVLNLSGLATSGAEGGGEETGVDGTKEEDGGAAPRNPLLGAVQLFGVLINTDVGKRAGLDAIEQGLAACSAILSAGGQLYEHLANLHAAVSAGIASLSSSASAAEPLRLPAAVIAAASAAMAPPARSERDLLWATPAALQTMRICSQVAFDTVASSAAADAALEASSGARDAFAAAVAKSASLGGIVITQVDVLHTLLRLTHGSAAVHLTALCSGAALAQVAAPSAKARAAVGAPVPSTRHLQSEVAALLALLSSSSAYTSLLAQESSTPGSAPSSCLRVCASLLESLQKTGNEEEGGNAGGKAGTAAPSSSSAPTAATSPSSPAAASAQQQAASAAMRGKLVAHLLTTVANIAALCTAGAAQLSASPTTVPMLLAHASNFVQELTSMANDTQREQAARGGALQLQTPALAAVFTALTALTACDATVCATMLHAGVLPLTQAAAALCANAASSGSATNASGSASGASGSTRDGNGNKSGSSSSSNGGMTTTGSGSGGGSNADQLAAEYERAPLLLAACASFCIRLIRDGGVLTAADSSSPTDGTSETAASKQATALCAVAQSLLVTLLTAKLFSDSTACWAAAAPLFLLVCDANAFTPADVASRMLTAVRAAAPRAVTAVRRVMSSTNAPPALLADCRSIVSLLQAKEAALAAAAAAAAAATAAAATTTATAVGEGAQAGGSAAMVSTVGTAASPVAASLSALGLSDADAAALAAVEASDEGDADKAANASDAASGAAAAPTATLADEAYTAVSAAYTQLLKVYQLFGAHGPDVVPKLEACLDCLREMAVVIVSYFPSPAMKDAPAVVSKPDTTTATVWQVFCTARDYVTTANALLAQGSDVPLPQAAVAHLFDIVSVATGVVCRLETFAAIARARQVAAYHAGTSPTWLLDAANDVLMDDAIAALGLAIDAHLQAAERTLMEQLAGGSLGSPTASTSASGGGGGGGGGVASWVYIPSLAAIDQLCNGIRALVAGCGHEAVRVLTLSGHLLNLLRLQTCLRNFEERTSAAGGASAGASSGASAGAAAQVEACVTSISNAMRFIIQSAQTDVTQLCTNDGTTDEAYLTDVTTLLPPAALAALLYASAAICVQAEDAAGDEDEDEDADAADASGTSTPGASERAAAVGIVDDDDDAAEDGDDVDVAPVSEAVLRRRAADAVLDSQVRAVFAARSGMAALTGVMEELGARTLSAATLGTVADADASANTKRVQLKLFSNILTVISEYLNAEAGRALPANMSVLRGVYAGIVSSMNIVMGDAYAQTTHTQALSNLYTDPAAGEHCSADASQAGPAASASASAALWAAPAHAVALSTADADALPVEEV